MKKVSVHEIEWGIERVEDMVEVDLIFDRAEDFPGLPQRNVGSIGQNISRGRLERQGIAFVSFG